MQVGIMAKSNKPGAPLPGIKLKAKPRRTHKVVVSLSDKEMEAINIYCHKYKVKSKSTFLREVTLKSIMAKFMDDYPTLFQKHELDSLMVKPNTQA